LVKHGVGGQRRRVLTRKSKSEKSEEKNPPENKEKLEKNMDKEE